MLYDYVSRRQKQFTHNGVSARDGRCVAGDSKAVGARVQASRVNSIHFTAMQGVVLRWQWLWFLTSKEKQLTVNQTNVLNVSLDLIISKIRPKCEGRAHQSVLWVDGSEGTMLIQMGGVSHHSRITRLNHRPGRTPWWWVEAFCWEGVCMLGRWEDNKGHIWDMSHYCDDLIHLQFTSIHEWHTGRG